MKRLKQKVALKDGLLPWARSKMSAAFALPPSIMHRQMAARAARLQHERGARIVYIAPRGNAKSTFWTFGYPIHCALEGFEPYIMLVGDTAGQARQHLEAIKSELEDNEQIRELYPDVEPVKSNTEKLKLSNGVLIHAIGTGQRVRGRKQGRHRPSLIIGDDVENDDHVRSATQREKNWTWFTSALLKAGTAKTNVVLVGSALHRDCVTMTAARTPGWERYLYQSIISYPKNMQLWSEWEEIFCNVDDPEAPIKARAFYDANREEMDAGAEVLWPEWESLYDLMVMRLMDGRASFEREKQSSPVNPDLCEFPDSYFDEHIWFDDWPEPSAAPCRIIALDPSKGKDSKWGDYSSYAMIAVSESGMIYCDFDMSKRPTPDMVAMGVEHYKAFRPLLFGCETNQWQELLAGDFNTAFRQAGILNPCFTAIENFATSKEVRIRRLGPLLSQRRIRFKRGSAGAKLCVDQLRDFPNGDHDDGPDSLEMAIRLAVDLWEAATNPTEY